MSSEKRFCTAFRALLLLVLGSLLPEPGRAQLPATAPLFHSLTAADGLAESTVYAAVQDRRGFLWLGTQDGLSRYDGSTFRNFRSDSQRRGSLSSNFVLALTLDSAGGLWVGTGGGGICRYNALANRFQTYQRTAPDTTGLADNFVRALLTDRRGRVWAGTEAGLHQFLPRQNKFRRCLLGPDAAGGVRYNSVRALAQTIDGRLWVGTGAGQLAWLDTTRQALQVLPGWQSPSPITALAAALDGGLWIGTEADGLRYQPPLGRPQPAFTLPATPAGLPHNAIRALLSDARGQLWVGTAAGLACFRPATGHWSQSFHAAGRAQSLPDDAVQCLYAGRNGLLWVGTEEGLASWDNQASVFGTVPLLPQPGPVWAVLEDDAGQLWAGTESRGLVQYNAATGQRRYHRNRPAEPGSLSQDFVRAVLRDRAGRLWVGTQSEGLDCLEPGATSFRHFRHNPADATSLGDNFIRALYQDRQGQLWVGTEGGLSRYNPATGRFRVFRYDAHNPASLPNNFVRVMLQDRRRPLLWVGTGGGGLSCLDLTTGRFRRYRTNPHDPRSLSSNFVRSLWQSPTGTLWIGTEGGGLCRLDREAGTGRFTTFREAQGLPNDVIYSLLPDDQGFLWLSTNKGLARLQPATGQIHSFTQQDGLAQDEFNAGAACRGRAGRLYFGGINGLVVFRPRAIRPNPVPPPVVLTGLRRFNQPVELPDTSITERRVLRLSPRDYFFTLEFAALNFRQPQKNHYAYQLEGFDPDWIPAGTRREATYTNLDPGTYTFRVRATNNDGLWNPVGTWLRIVVEPPWYQTWWFRLLLSGSIFGVLFLLYRVRVRQLLALEQVRHGIARDLHDDMGSTLSSISILSQIARNHQHQHRPEQAAAVLAQIGDSSRRMLDAMDDIVWAINPDHDSLEDVTARMRRFASEVLETAGIEFSFQADASLQGLKLDMHARREFFLLFKEAINNLAKYAHCRHATIALHYRQGHLELIVHDDGVGFDMAAPAQGGGNGLTNMRARAAALQGTLTLHSAPGQGTTVHLSVPLR